jgi:hypothetical protein
MRVLRRWMFSLCSFSVSHLSSAFKASLDFIRFFGYGLALEHKQELRCLRTPKGRPRPHVLLSGYTLHIGIL